MFHQHEHATVAAIKKNSCKLAGGTNARVVVSDDMHMHLRVWGSRISSAYCLSADALEDLGALLGLMVPVAGTNQ
jgi:hypothetical protein